jgi:predicted DCC family thiol-disulfide oxidoreductase YuxK
MATLVAEPLTAETPLEMPAARGRVIVLYDGVCALCNGSVRFLLPRDRQDRFRFAPLQGTFARRALARHGKDARDLNTLGVIADYQEPTEHLLTRAAAVLYLLSVVGGVWRLSAVARILPMAVLDRVYDFIVAHRYRWFGRYNACPLPPPEQRRKFVDS